MSDQITINSVNYSGEVANIVFKPDNSDNVINMGNQILPYTFDPSLFTPPLEVYGTFTILLINSDCPYFMEVPRPTPTPTPTVTPTRTPTPTPTSTPTPTPTNNPCNTPTPTSTPTPTPTPTPVYRAYLFIEPITGSTDIGQWMYDEGTNFYGFSNASQPSQDQSNFNIEMNKYVDFSGWTSGLFPQIINQIVPQVSGGIDSFGNSIVEFNFLTIEVPENTVSVESWYTWIIPTSLTNNQRQTEIDLNVNGNPNLFTTVSTEGTINVFTFTYSGSTIPQTIYKVYTTYPSPIFKISNDDNIYFRGNTIST